MYAGILRAVSHVPATRAKLAPNVTGRIIAIDGTSVPVACQLYESGNAVRSGRSLKRYSVHATGVVNVRSDAVMALHVCTHKDERQGLRDVIARGRTVDHDGKPLLVADALQMVIKPTDVLVMDRGYGSTPLFRELHGRLALPFVCRVRKNLRLVTRHLRNFDGRRGSCTGHYLPGRLLWAWWGQPSAPHGCVPARARQGGVYLSAHLAPPVHGEQRGCAGYLWCTLAHRVLLQADQVMPERPRGTVLHPLGCHPRAVHSGHLFVLAAAHAWQRARS